MTRGEREIAFDQWRVPSSVQFPFWAGMSCPSAGCTPPAQRLLLIQGRVFRSQSAKEKKKVGVRRRLRDGKPGLPLLSCSLSFSSSLLASFFSFMYMCPCVYIGVCGGQRLTLGIFSNYCCNFLRQSLSLYLELADLAVMAVCGAPGVLLSNQRELYPLIGIC